MVISLMKTISPSSSEIIAFLRQELEIGENVSIKQEGMLNDNYPIRFDLIIKDDGKTYVVEIKRIVRLEALSRLGLLKLLLNADNISNYDIEFVMVGKRITPEAAEAAEKTGMRFIKLPADVNLEEARPKSSALSVKLTSPKSWQAISYLLKIKEASIRQLAIASGVSYGWTHATVKALASKGIASANRGLVEIADKNKLLNGIAWERPFEKLFAQEIRIAAESPMALAQEICLVCDQQQIPSAFSSYTAAEIYTGYSARHDSIYLYIERKNIDEVVGMFEVQNEGGTAVRIYAPDRDVFKDRRISTVEGVWLVSPDQALLDCAGLGYAGRDLTLRLVEIYDRL